MSKPIRMLCYLESRAEYDTVLIPEDTDYRIPLTAALGSGKYDEVVVIQPDDTTLVVVRDIGRRWFVAQPSLDEEREA